MDKRDWVKRIVDAIMDDEGYRKRHARMKSLSDQDEKDRQEAGHGAAFQDLIRRLKPLSEGQLETVYLTGRNPWIEAAPTPPPPKDEAERRRRARRPVQTTLVGLFLVTWSARTRDAWRRMHRVVPGSKRPGVTGDKGVLMRPEVRASEMVAPDDGRDPLEAVQGRASGLRVTSAHEEDVMTWDFVEGFCRFHDEVSDDAVIELHSGVISARKLREAILRELSMDLRRLEDDVECMRVYTRQEERVAYLIGLEPEALTAKALTSIKNQCDYQESKHLNPLRRDYLAMHGYGRAFEAFVGQFTVAELAPGVRCELGYFRLKRCEGELDRTVLKKLRGGGGASRLAGLLLPYALSVLKQTRQEWTGQKAAQAYEAIQKSYDEKETAFLTHPLMRAGRREYEALSLEYLPESVRAGSPKNPFEHMYALRYFAMHREWPLYIVEMCKHGKETRFMDLALKAHLDAKRAAQREDDEVTLEELHKRLRALGIDPKQAEDMTRTEVHRMIDDVFEERRSPDTVEKVVKVWTKARAGTSRAVATYLAGMAALIPAILGFGGTTLRHGGTPRLAELGPALRERLSANGIRLVPGMLEAYEGDLLVHLYFLDGLPSPAPEVSVGIAQFEGEVRSDWLEWGRLGPIMAAARLIGHGAALDRLRHCPLTVDYDVLHGRLRIEFESSAAQLTEGA